MKIIIVGDGKVGITLTQQLASEGHEIIVIDQNEEALRHVSELYDVLSVCGNGASMQVLQEANA
ncbi:MAG: NAD-binding protein, partial [Clostridia bacterium]|nr:NAD-binding protein [Clostridia bacterium]